MFERYQDEMMRAVTRVGERLLLGLDPKLFRSSPGGVGGMSTTGSVVVVSRRGLLILRVVHVCASTIATAK